MHSRRQVLYSVLAAVAGFALATVQPVLVHASTWRRVPVTASPSARLYPAMAYDPVSQNVVLFGGLSLSGNMNDTWEFDGAKWTQVVTSIAPPVRNGASMAFDQLTNKLVLFGGFDTDHYLPDTWVFDGATSTWTEERMPSPPPKATGAVLFTDPLSGAAMMFGGYNSFYFIPAFNRTYRWTGTSWQQLNPSTVPIPRGWGIATLDPLRHNVVLTAGTGDTIRTDNTWTWDGTDWASESPKTQIPAYIGAGSAFDPAMQTVVVFGAAGDTWSWTGTDWVQLDPASSPSARSAFGMAYDPITNQTIIFGGQTSSGGLAGGTWQLFGQ